MSEKNISESGSEKPDKPEVRYVPVEYVHSSDPKEAEMGILDFLKFIWLGRKTVIKFTITFAAIGIFIFLFGPTEYESDSILLQETQQSGMQELQLLQSLGGFGGGAGSSLSSEGIPPSLYPEIVNSMAFQKQVIQKEIEFSEYNISSNLMDFFEENYSPPFTERIADFLLDYTVKLPVTIYKGISYVLKDTTESSSPVIVDEDIRYLTLNSKERSQINEMLKRIEIEMNGGLITIKTILPDPKAAAEINNYVIELIQEYVINYRVEKARQNLKFIEEQTEEAKSRYDVAQKELANFRDQNVSLATATARTQQEELQSIRDIRFNVYNSLAQEVEQARIKLQEDTPVFNVLQKSFIPTSSVKSSIFIIIGAAIFGFISGVGWIFSLHGYRIVRDHISN